MDLDIVVLPPAALGKQIGELMHEIHRQFGLAMVVDNDKLLPHISLFHLRTASDQIRDIIASTKDLAKSHKALELAFIEPKQGKRFFAISVHRTKDLYALHEKVVKRISGYRDGITNLPPGKKNAIQRCYMKEYGVGNVLEYFRPHITLGWTKMAEQVPKIFQKIIKAKWPKFVARRLAVTQVDRHHQVIKIVKEFKLA